LGARNGLTGRAVEDRDEADADRRAESVMRTTDPKKSVDFPEPVHAGRHRAGGQPLTADLRAFFEPRFGRTFADVRIHTDPAAQTSADALGARAFTTGGDIAFAADEYQPSSAEGKRLIAHELAHYVQQRTDPSLASGATAPVQTKRKKARDRKATPKPVVVPWSKTEDTVEGSLKVWLKAKFGGRVPDAVAEQIASEIVTGGKFKTGTKRGERDIAEPEFVEASRTSGGFPLDESTLAKLADSLVQNGVAATAEEARTILTETDQAGASSDVETPGRTGGEPGQEATGEQREEAVPERKTFDRASMALWVVRGGSSTRNFSPADEIDIDTLTQGDFKAAAESALGVALRVQFPEIKRQIGTLLPSIMNDLRLIAPDVETSRGQGVSSIEVLVDAEGVRALLMEKYRYSEEELAQPEGLLLTIEIPTDTARQAEILQTGVDLAAAASAGRALAHTAERTLVKEARKALRRQARQARREARQVKKQARKEAKQAKSQAEREERADAKFERVAERSEELNRILTDPTVARNVLSLTRKTISEHKLLAEIWERVRKIKSISEFARTTDKGSPWAKYRARLAYDAHRDRFWEAVANNKEARAIIERSGFKFVGEPGTAPIFPGVPGKAGRLSIDHVARIELEPFKALDPKNLRFVTDEENAFLRRLEMAMQKHQKARGGTFE
jgi:hypothetical protein